MNKWMKDGYNLKNAKEMRQRLAEMRINSMNKHSGFASCLILGQGSQRSEAERRLRREHRNQYKKHGGRETIHFGYPGIKWYPSSSI